MDGTLKKFYPDEKTLRKTSFVITCEKLEKRHLSGNDVRLDKFVELAADKQVTKYIGDVRMKLSDAYSIIDEIEDKKS